MAILLSLTGESGSIFALIPWMPWQVVQVGESAPAPGSETPMDALRKLFGNIGMA